MLYAPRGIGKTLLGLSIALAVSSGASLLRWSAPKPRRVLYIDGEMPLADLQDRLSAISIGLGAENQNGGFQILAADQTESGINLVSPAVQQEIDPLLKDLDLLVLDNLSTLCTTGSESASDAWVPMQNWLLRLRRQGVAVLLIHHAGTNGGSGVLPGERMRWIPSSLSDDLRITRPSRGLDLRFTSRSFGKG